jgi:hypothetical protein
MLGGISLFVSAAVLISIPRIGMSAGGGGHIDLTPMVVETGVGVLAVCLGLLNVGAMIGLLIRSSFVQWSTGQKRRDLNLLACLLSVSVALNIAAAIWVFWM